MRFPTILAVLAGLVACPLHAQQMYKWVDEKGVTHYSESPPPDGTKGAARIEVKTTTPDRTPPTDNWREREAQSKAQKARQGVADEQVRQKEESQRADNCRKAQRRVDVLNHPGGVYRLNEKGERVFMEDKERDSNLEDARQDVARYCR